MFEIEEFIDIENLKEFWINLNPKEEIRLEELNEIFFNPEVYLEPFYQ